MNQQTTNTAALPMHLGAASRRGFLGALAAMALPLGAKAQASAVLRIATATEPTSFDPHYTYFGPNRQAHMPVFEPLVMFAPDLSLKPALATRWEATAANLWEIDLRRNVRFHDGNEFTAADVIFSLERVKSIRNSPSTLGVYLQSIEALKALSPHRLLIETKGPAPLLMFDLANIPIMSHRASQTTTTAELDAGKGIVGTGPYQFVRWDKGSLIEYASFNRHWSGRPSWSSVRCLWVPDSDARVKSLVNGEVDFIDQVPPASAPALRERSDVNVMSIASNFVIFLHMDQFRKTSPYVKSNEGTDIDNPLLDRRVRKAISLAIDRQRLVDHALAGAAQPASQLLPSTFAGTIPALAVPTQDLAEARRLLSAAGYANGFRLTMHGTRGRYANDVAVIQEVARQLQGAGITASAESLPSGEFFARASSGLRGEPEFSMIQVGWASIEPSGALKGLLATYDQKAGSGSSNRGRYSHPRVDALLAEALKTADEQKRSALLVQATQVAVVEDQGIVPLYYPTNTWAGRKGLRFSPRVDSSTFPMDIEPG